MKQQNWGFGDMIANVLYAHVNRGQEVRRNKAHQRSAHLDIKDRIYPHVKIDPPFDFGIESNPNATQNIPPLVEPEALESSGLLIMIFMLGVLLGATIHLILCW